MLLAYKNVYIYILHVCFTYSINIHNNLKMSQKIASNIEPKKVVFQAHNSRGGSFKGKRKSCWGWHTGEGKSQEKAKKGKAFFFSGIEGNSIVFRGTQRI
jgi:hypothetical protein